MDSPQLPTADQFAALEDAYRRDTRSGFVPLAYALLMLGRPGDAVLVCSRGLAQDPDSSSGRLYLGSALASMHRWNEAQTELLKVVQSDRNSTSGFRLLGEVLMRRNDFQRALPVLQHAQALNPGDGSLAVLVERAKRGQPLAPPVPVPTPLHPTGVRGAASPPQAGSRGAPALARLELQQRVVDVAGQGAPVPVRNDTGRPEERLQASPQLLGSYPSAPRTTPASPAEPVPRVRPRVIPAVKPKDAAQEGLRNSAAAGEQYLSQLLHAGLLDIPNVRIEEAIYRASPTKRWGRSSSRMLGYLLGSVLIFGAGCGAWYWYSEKQVAADISRHLEVATLLVESADQGDLQAAAEEAIRAGQADRGDEYSASVLAEARGLLALLYGDSSMAQAKEAITAVGDKSFEVGQAGHREMVVARAATSLAGLRVAGSEAMSNLISAREELETWLAHSPKDALARWLLARCFLAAGDRNGAKVALEQAYGAGEGPAIAVVELANFHLDEGEYESAIRLFDEVLSGDTGHALAFVGRSLARSERHLGAEEAMADISIGLSKADGGRLLAWKALALAVASQSLGDYEAMATALDEADSENKPRSPRFLARLGLARVAQGRIQAATEIRGSIRWFGPHPQESALVRLLDVELLLAQGLGATAITMLEGVRGIRAASLRGRAYFDSGDMRHALAAFEQALATSPDDMTLQAWAEAARMIVNDGSVRSKADEALGTLGRKATTKTARLLHGIALAATGKTAFARDKLKNSVTDISEAFPNPLLYRSYVALGEIALKKGNAAAAKKYLGKALGVNPGYFPAKELMGRALVGSEPKKALGYFREVVNAGAASVAGELALARALARTGGDTQEAAEAIGRARDKGASGSALQRVISEIDPQLFEALGVSPP